MQDKSCESLFSRHEGQHMVDPQRTELAADGFIHHLYFAAIPPTQIKDRIAAVWHKDGSGENFRRDVLHLSLQNICPPGILDRSKVAMAQIAATRLRHAGFTLTFDRLMTFGGGAGKRALVLATDNSNHAANDLAIELRRLLAEVAVKCPTKTKITPHVTLAYGLGFAGTRYLADPIRWTIQDITVIDSLIGQARHVHLGTWRLVTD
jgi:RNA 2',3'-cyclic 3'-phosphodiesterase